jgi:heterodisulfide reductase subunit B
LSYSGGVRVRHLLDVLQTDIGSEGVAEAVSHSLEGLVVAPYYGCQILRPYPEFDDPERPTSMESMLTAMGAEVLDWNLGARCCGASLITTRQDAALANVAKILEGAAQADVIVTVCPMCQMNLEAYQGRALAGSDAGKISIAYLPQLMAVSFGLSIRQAGLDKNLAMAAGLLKRLKEGQREQEPDEAKTEEQTTT